MNKLTPSLDDLYRMVAHIYGEQNAQRPPSATFAHFVEVCGMLTVAARKKKRKETLMLDALCKSLAWFFPLMARFNVKSVEELVYRKYPYACPYCHRERHQDTGCKTLDEQRQVVNKAALSRLYNDNLRRRPHTLDEWQEMFRTIYPRSTTDSPERSVVGLTEELGELAEAVRVAHKHPKYFAGEAADVFSYLMGFANEYIINLALQEGGHSFSFSEEFVKRYPGLCAECGHLVCACPAIPEATVGRLTKELDLVSVDEVFSLDPRVLQEEGEAIAGRVLAHLGGYRGLIERFPFDRGDTNRALVLLCVRVADEVEGMHADVARQLRSAAFNLVRKATHAGSKVRPPENPEIQEAVQAVQSVLQTSQAALAGPIEKAIEGEGSPLMGEIASLLGPPGGSHIEIVMGNKYQSEQVGAQGVGAQVHGLQQRQARQLGDRIVLTCLAGRA